MTHQLLIIKSNVFWSVSPAFYKKFYVYQRLHMTQQANHFHLHHCLVLQAYVYNYSVINFLYLRANFVISLEFTPFLDVVTGRNVG